MSKNAEKWFWRVWKVLLGLQIVVVIGDILLAIAQTILLVG